MDWVKLDTKTINIRPLEEFYTVAEAGSFEELKEIMPDLVIPKGERVRFVMELNQPVAPAFNMPGAELLFRAVIPEGLTLIDVRGEGWTTAIVECESDPIHLAAIGAFLLLHWKALALIAIGITLALGFLILSIRVDATKAVEAIPEAAKWVAIGLFGAAALGLTYLAIKKRR